MPVLSVIMSVYNADDYQILLKSVESILKQSFRDFEFIICNDGSTNNNTLNFLKKINNLDSRIKIIGYHQNRGLGYSRNECIKRANGKYIAYQDDDDISEPTRLEEEIEFLNNNPQFSFVGTNANVFNEKGVWGEYNLPENPNKKDFLWNSPFLNPSMMFRKDTLYQVKGYRVSKYTQRVEDYDLFFRLYAKGFRGHNIQDKLFDYRIEIENERNKKYRPMKYRINEAIVRYKGFKKLNMNVMAFPFVFKPIVIGFIPSKIFYYIRKKQYR